MVLNTLTNNVYAGLLISNGASNDKIGISGDNLDDNTMGNVITYNQRGISIETGASGNLIIYNDIGIDSSRQVVGNTQSGIVIDSASGNSIEANGIRGGYNGVVITGAASQHNDLSGNYISNNTNIGVEISNEAANNTIGDVQLDVISANGVGVQIDSQAHDNLISYNYIGTDTQKAITAGFGNTISGIVFNNASHNTAINNEIVSSDIGVNISGSGHNITW